MNAEIKALSEAYYREVESFQRKKEAYVSACKKYVRGILHSLGLDNDVVYSLNNSRGVFKVTENRQKGDGSCNIQFFPYKSRDNAADKSLWRCPMTNIVISPTHPEDAIKLLLDDFTKVVDN